LCEALAAVAASAADDSVTRKKLVEAAKFLGCRNQGKPRGQIR
jgi:hypothetical protein